MKNKYVGLLIVGIAILIFSITFSFTYALDKVNENVCSMDGCPMSVTIHAQKMVNYALMGLLVVVGIFVAFFMKDESTKNESVSRTLSEEEKKEKLEHLDEEEKQVINLVLAQQGSIYQSDIISQSGLTKVKVSRIIDKLEGRGLVERKRRGMTNIVLLRN